MTIKEVTIMVKKEAQNKKSVVMSILNSPISIIVVLMLFSIGLIIYSRYLVRCNVIYTFYGYTEDFSFFGGTIYEGPLINYFGDSKVLYTGDDIVLYDFEVGFYIHEDNEYRPIAVMKGYDTTDGEESSSKKEVKGASFKDILEGTSFSFTETHKEAQFLSKDNMKDLDKLVFRAHGKDNAGKEVDIEVPLTTEKITK